MAAWACAYAAHQVSKEPTTPQNSPNLDWWCHRHYVRGQAPCWYGGCWDTLKQGAPLGAYYGA